MRIAVGFRIFSYLSGSLDTHYSENSQGGASMLLPAQSLSSSKFVYLSLDPSLFFRLCKSQRTSPWISASPIFPNSATDECTLTMAQKLLLLEHSFSHCQVNKTSIRPQYTYQISRIKTRKALRMADKWIRQSTK